MKLNGACLVIRKPLQASSPGRGRAKWVSSNLGLAQHSTHNLAVNFERQSIFPLRERKSNDSNLTSRPQTFDRKAGLYPPLRLSVRMTPGHCISNENNLLTSLLGQQSWVLSSTSRSCSARSSRTSSASSRVSAAGKYVDTFNQLWARRDQFSGLSSPSRCLEKLGGGELGAVASAASPLLYTR